MRFKEKFSEILVVSFCLFTLMVGMNIIIENTLPLGVIIFTVMVSILTLLLSVVIIGSWVKEYREEKKRKDRTY
jgi:predicted tellurium resistance membrane protein TerC